MVFLQNVILGVMLLLSYVLLGCYALIVQVVCIREILVAFYGNELCLGVIFACWLVGVAVGAAIFARIIERIRQKLLLYIFLLILMGFLFPLQIYSIRILRSLLHIPPGEFISLVKLLFGALSTITPFSFFVGAIFPVACSLLPITTSQSSSPDSRHIGRIYIAEAVGSIIGGVAFTFFLVTRYNAFQIAALSGSLVFLMAGILVLVYGDGKLKFVLLIRKMNFALLIGVVSFVGCGVYGYTFFSSTANTLHNLTIEKRWESMHRDIELVKSVDSKYENLALGIQAGQYVLFTNGQYASIFPDEYGAAVTAHFYMTEHPAPRNVLLIGGGAEGLIGEILKHPVEKLDYVELDPKLLDLLFEYLPSDTKHALKDPRVSVIYADGRYYVKQAERRYDVVILNIPDPTNAMLNRFYTLESFQEVQHILNPGGVVITEVSSSLHLQEDPANYTGSIYKTLRTLFPYILVVPGTTNTYFATSEPDVITFDTKILGRRYLERGIVSDYFSEYHYDTLLQQEQIAFIESTLQQRQNTFRINTDFQPVSYFYSLILWTQFSETDSWKQTKSITGQFFHILNRLSAWWFFVPLILFILIRIMYIFPPFFKGGLGGIFRKSTLKKQTRFNCLWAIGTTGFAGMALELILIFAFQNIYGYIYQKAGLIVAVFMIGLAAGGYSSHTIVRRQEKNSPNIDSRSLLKLRESSFLFYLFYVEITIVIFAGLLPFCIRLLSSSYFFPTPTVVEILFMVLVGIAGILTGFEFPLVSAIYLHSQRKLGKTAGMIDSADHIGAFCGSILVGILFVPLLGITTSCYFVSVLNLSSVLFLLLQKTTHYS
jgi:spermidine synthase